MEDEGTGQLEEQVFSEPFVERLRVEMRRESEDAEVLALAVGLPPSAKYQLMAALVNGGGLSDQPKERGQSLNEQQPGTRSPRSRA